MDEMRIFCQTHKPHIFAVNETWLDSSISDGEVYIEGYSLVRRDKARHKGGVLIYIDKALNFVELEELRHIVIESLWAKIKPNKSKGFVMCSCYTSLQIWNMIKSS